jgi:ferredoxin
MAPPAPPPSRSPPPWAPQERWGRWPEAMRSAGHLGLEIVDAGAEQVGYRRHRLVHVHVGPTPVMVRVLHLGGRGCGRAADGVAHVLRFVRGLTIEGQSPGSLLGLQSLSNPQVTLARGRKGASHARKQGGIVRDVVNETLCEGNALCAGMAPEVFDLGGRAGGPRRGVENRIPTWEVDWDNAVQAPHVDRARLGEAPGGGSTTPDHTLAAHHPTRRRVP